MFVSVAFSLSFRCLLVRMACCPTMSKEKSVYSCLERSCLKTVQIVRSSRRHPPVSLISLQRALCFLFVSFCSLQMMNCTNRDNNAHLDSLCLETFMLYSEVFKVTEDPVNFLTVAPIANPKWSCLSGWWFQKVAEIGVHRHRKCERLRVLNNVQERSKLTHKDFSQGVKYFIMAGLTLQLEDFRKISSFMYWTPLQASSSSVFFSTKEAGIIKYTTSCEPEDFSHETQSLKAFIKLDHRWEAWISVVLYQSAEEFGKIWIYLYGNVKNLYMQI